MSSKQKLADMEREAAKKKISNFVTDCLFSTDLFSTLARAAGVDRTTIIIEELRSAADELESAQKEGRRIRDIIDKESRV